MDTCPFCQEDRETLENLFLRCHFARAVWLGSEITVRTDTLPYHTISDWIVTGYKEAKRKSESRPVYLPCLLPFGVFGITEKA